MNKKLDLRVEKTYQALTNALYALLCEKSLGQLTVTELCDRAMIRKATFYKHFADKEELLVFMIRELQRLATEQNTVGYDPVDPHSYYIGVFRYFIDFLDSNERFIRSILGSNASSVAEELLAEQIRLDMSSHLKKEELETLSKANDMFAALYAGAVISCGKWWITQENRPNKESVIKGFSEFILKF